jgi:tRNA pseudouridine32 synthase/23S rRNA pseudouridine746 synthase
MTPEEMVCRLLYRDGLMLVIDKPPGLAVHNGPKGGVCLQDYFGALTFGLPRAPSLAHRLDRDTSGCLVLGRHRKALANLGKLFKNGSIGKTYWAVVEGGPAGDEGRIELPLGRLDDTRGWWMKPDPDGQPSTTVWKVLGRSGGTELSDSPAAAAALSVSLPGKALSDSPLPCGEGAGVGVAAGRDSTRPSSPTLPHEGGGSAPSARQKLPPTYTWLALEPLTGRTHQLRVHCAAMGWPIVGDAIYGSAPRAGGPILHLQAREVVVPLYKNREPIRVAAPVPDHMRAVLMRCGWTADDPQASAHSGAPTSALNKALP